MSETNDVLALWNELKELVHALELDVQKNVAGTASAGVRARKGLRAVVKIAHSLVKASTARDKSLKVAKLARRVEAAAQAEKVG